MGFELARQNHPQQPQVQYNPVDLIKTFADLIRENVQKPMEELVRRVQPQPSTLEKILLDDKLFERFKSLGLFGGGQPQQASPEIQLEIEKLRQERDFKLKEMEQQHQRWMMEQQMQMQRDERRWQVVQNLMQGPLGRVIQTVGGAAAAKIGGSQPPKPVLASCPNCGGTFYTSSDAKIAVCPHCNNLLRAAGEGEVEVPPKQEEKTPASSKESK